MKKNDKIITVKNPGRLDVVLAEQINISRSQAQKLIAAELVLVNNQLPKKAGGGVRVGDKIEISNFKFLISNKNPNSKFPKIKAPTVKLAPIIHPSIVADTPEYVVLEKPTGLLVHPTMAGETNTLADWLVKKYPKIKKVGDRHPSFAKEGSGGGLAGHTYRPGIVHRLDKEASGLMVVAKTQAMFDHLKEQFKNRTIAKEYLALVHGRVTKDWDEITFAIARSETFNRMAARPLKMAKYISTLAPKTESGLDDEPALPGEKSAHTEFFVEKRFVNCTLLRVILHTGRMHQIRVHLLAYNHPLVGDPLYLQKKRKRNLDEKLGRLFLHSVKLGFTDLDGVRQEFTAELPEKLNKFLGDLK